MRGPYGGAAVWLVVEAAYVAIGASHVRLIPGLSSATGELQAVVAEDFGHQPDDDGVTSQPGL